MSVIDVCWSDPAGAVFISDANPVSIPTFSTQPFTVTAGSIDTTYTSHGFIASLNNNQLFVESPTLLTTFWLHYAVKTGTANAAEQGTTPINGVPSVIFYHNGLQQYRMGRGATSATNWYFMKTLNNGTTWTQVGTFATIPAATLMNIDVKIVVSATVGEVTIFKDGVSVFTFTGDTSCGSGGVSKIRMGSGINSLAATNNIYSQIILADENTVGWKLQTLKVLSGDAPGQFLGDWNQVKNSTYTAAAANSVSANVDNSAIFFGVTDSVVNGLVVDSVWVAAKKKKSGNATVTKVTTGLKVGAIPYYDGILATSASDVEVTQKVKWANNPSNMSGWTHADVNGLEIGFKVVV